MLTQVLRPRADDEGLDVAIANFGIAIQAPARCAVAAADVVVLLHRLYEGAGLVRIDEILDRHEHRTIVELEAEVRHQRRHAPMVPGADVGGCSGETPEVAGGAD